MMKSIDTIGRDEEAAVRWIRSAREHGYRIDSMDAYRLQMNDETGRVTAALGRLGYEIRGPEVE